METVVMSGNHMNNETEHKSPRETGEDSEDESEILEESPCGRWLKRREEVSFQQFSSPNFVIFAQLNLTTYRRPFCTEPVAHRMRFQLVTSRIDV